jgi:DNA-binding MarR family transcriptional regulator
MADLSESQPGIGPREYAAIAAFRLELRRFLAFSEAAATRAGLPPQQHQAILAIAGHVGEGPPGVGALAEQLIVAHHTATELVARMVDAGLLTKTAGVHDRRRVGLALTHKAQSMLHSLTSSHLEELESLEPALARALGRLSKRRPTMP